MDKFVFFYANDSFELRPITSTTWENTWLYLLPDMHLKMKMEMARFYMCMCTTYTYTYSIFACICIQSHTQDNTTHECMHATCMYNTHTHNIIGSVADLSARTILVFVTFSMVNFVFPPVPATRPIARDKWSPFNGFTERNTDNSQDKNQLLLYMYMYAPQLWQLQ